MVITQHNVHFFADKKQSVHLQHDHHWPLADLVSVQRRRYLLRNSALEIFLVDNSSYFVNFPAKDKVRFTQHTDTQNTQKDACNAGR